MLRGTGGAGELRGGHRELSTVVSVSLGLRHPRPCSHRGGLSASALIMVDLSGRPGPTDHREETGGVGGGAAD